MTLRDRIASLGGYCLSRRGSGRAFRPVIEVTNACNLRCIMCPRAAMRRAVRHMAPALFEKIITENRAALEFVSLNGYGEPLLHPGLAGLLRVCREQGVPAGISTNCTRLDAAAAQALLDEPPAIVTLAIDGVEREIYETVRVGASFGEVMENARRFLDLRQKAAAAGRRVPFVILQCIVMPETRGQIRAFRSFFKETPADALRIRQLTHSGRDRDAENYRNAAGSCYWIWTEPMILSDGTVVPCCQDVNGELALGNIAQTPLQELWAKGAIEEIRARHGRGERDRLPVCRGCNMYQPGVVLSCGAALVPTLRLNTLVPRIETLISQWRYRK